MILSTLPMLLRTILGLGLYNACFMISEDGRHDSHEIPLLSLLCICDLIPSKTQTASHLFLEQQNSSKLVCFLYRIVKDKSNIITLCPFSIGL